MVSTTLKSLIITIIFSSSILSSSLSHALLKRVSHSDIEIMNEARTYFEKKDFEKSLKLYSMVRPSSVFWLESIEERAWVYTRQGKYEDALADLQSLISPVWGSQIGSESYMLSTFLSLKLCNYKEVLKKIKLFKSVMIPRVELLTLLSNKELSDKNWQLFLDLQKNNWNAVEKDLAKFPRYFYLDHQFLTAMKQKNRNKASDRIQDLAREDISEIRENLKKMKVIDIELTQNVLLPSEENTIDKNALKFQAINKNDYLSFPMEGTVNSLNESEVWTDEVGHFQVKTNKCISILGKGGAI